MSTTETQEPTPEHVADLATEQTRMDRTALIGIFGSASAPGALVRTPNGEIARVTVGDSVAGGTVAAIADGQLLLAFGSRTKALKLPKG
jgi:hypothetical protein